MFLRDLESPAGSASEHNYAVVGKRRQGLQTQRITVILRPTSEGCRSMTDSTRLLASMIVCCIGSLCCPATAQTAAPTTYVLVPLPPPPPKPNHLPYEPGQRVPDGYHIEERASRGLVIAGALTLGIPWAWGAATASDTNFEGKSSYLLIPVAGPWIFLATRDGAGCSNAVCIASNSVLVLDGAAQAAGAIMLTAAFMYPRKQLVLNNEVSVAIVPTSMGRNGYGLGAIGSF